ncbi:KH domain-containing RNA-binding protein QKI-like isoform X2 [Petromyzon marinus]|uniref:KH domain-containing RNA-binding protein QKI-like isoform X2 n=1 Tax=Petromyzon marinus TaxID=7757 RepID=UPI003F7268DC
MVRGRGSMRDKKKEEQNRGKPNWEHLSEELHVLVTVEDSPNRADVKLRHAVDEVKKLLVPSGEGEDNLKKLQLMELAIINGTYRDAAQPRHREYCTQGQLQQLQHHHQQQQQLQQLQQQQQLPFATSMVPAPPPMAFTMAGPPLTAAHGHRFLAAAAAAAQQLHLAGPGAQQFHLRGASPGGGQVPGGMGGVPGVPGVPSPGMCLPFMRPLHPMLGGPGVPGVPGVPADTPGLVYTSYEYPCLLEYPLDHTGVLGAVPTKVRRHDSRVHPYQRDRVGGSRPPATTEGGGATLTTTSGPPGG